MRFSCHLSQRRLGFDRGRKVGIQFASISLKRSWVLPLASRRCAIEACILINYLRLRARAIEFYLYEKHPMMTLRLLCVCEPLTDFLYFPFHSLFVCRYKLSAQDELEIIRLLPIYGSFSIVMTQTRHGSIDLRPDTGKAAHDQSRSGNLLPLCQTPSH